MKTTELKFEKEADYYQGIEITIKLKQIMSNRDYMEVVSAANKIMDIVGAYIPNKVETKK